MFALIDDPQRVIRGPRALVAPGEREIAFNVAVSNSELRSRAVQCRLRARLRDGERVLQHVSFNEFVGSESGTGVGALVTSSAVPSIDCATAVSSSL